MKAVVCRCHRAAVVVEGRTVGSIERGLLVFLGVMQGDTAEQGEWMAGKLTALRLFNDAEGKINLSVKDIVGGILFISNFTLAGDTRKGTRPSFSSAARPEEAKLLFDSVVTRCGQAVKVATGVFGAHMDIAADFDGPVTVIVESPVSS